MMEERGKGVQGGKPDDHVPECRVNLGDRPAKLVLPRQQRAERRSGEEGKRMAFEPGPKNPHRRDADEKRVERQVDGSRRQRHPGRHRRLLRGTIDATPQDPQQCDRKNEDAEGFMGLPREIHRRRIDPRLRAARAHDIGGADQDDRQPMETPRHGAVVPAATEKLHGLVP
jgi:hypothetical protein